MIAVAVCAAVLPLGGCAASRRAPLPYPDSAPPAHADRPEEAIAAEAGAIAGLALSLQGTPYENGASGPAAFDCSGLVQYVFARAGVPLPRSVREQVEAGSQVDGDAQPGDLLFFAMDGEHVSHVGIATGPGTFVHAPSSRGFVRQERFDAPYWARRLILVRRILIEKPE